MFYAELPCMGYISCCCLVFCILLKPFIIILGIKKTANTIAVTSIKGILNMYEKLSIFTFNTRIVNLYMFWIVNGNRVSFYCVIILYFDKSCIWISYEKKQQPRICNAIFKWTLDPKKLVPWSQTGVLICYHNCISLFILFA